MLNPYTYNEHVCGRCGATHSKQIPEQWDDDNHIFFFENWFFCLECGYHFPVQEKQIA